MIKDITRLQDNELFGSLTEDELSKIAPLCSDFVAIEGATILMEGRNASHLYVVTDGQVALQKWIRPPHGTRSRRTTITLCRPGEIVGWSALVEPYKYTLSAVAWEHTRLINIDAKMLRRTLDTHPEIGYKVMSSLAAVVLRRLRQTTGTLINEREVSFAGLDARYVRGEHNAV